MTDIILPTFATCVDISSDQLLLLSFVFIFLTGAECFAVHLWAPTHPKMAQKVCVFSNSPVLKLH